MSQEEKAKGDEREESQSRNFKVEDRRKLTSEGDIREAAAGEPAGTRTSAGDSDFRESPPRASGSRPPVDFSAFIMSLATSAMAFMGDVPDPVTGRQEENLEEAQQMIDLLAMLQVKTKGNLEPDEHRLLDDLLYELRMRYLAKSKVVKL